jgi:hypothetical protein
MFTHSKNVESNLLRQFYFFHQVFQPLMCAETVCLMKD